MAEYGRLKIEIDMDPETLGYSGKTDVEVSVLLNTANRPVTGAFTITSVQLYEAVDDTEFNGLSADKKAHLRDILSLSEIPLGNTRVRRILRSLFPAGQPTRAALAALQPPDITRAQEIGLGEGRTRESDVFKARAL